MYQEALALIKAGSIGNPDSAGHKGTAGRFPWGEFTTRFGDASELYDWFETRGWQLAGVCGGVSGNLVVIDFDRADQQDGGYEEHATRHPAIRGLPRARTGRGRIHVYCRSKVPTDKYVVGDDGSRIEIRGGNHYCVAPPSIHPGTGEAYAWVGEHTLGMGIPTIDLETIGFEARQRTGSSQRASRARRAPRSLRPKWSASSSSSGRSGARGNGITCHWRWPAGWLGYSVPEADATAVIAALAVHEDAETRRHVARNVRDAYEKWRQGIAVAGWSMLTDSQSPLISRGAAAQYGSGS